jgi:hypothetical protein
VRKALRQVALGNYAGETTPLGTALQILAGLAGVDAPADVRDLFYDLTHWENTTEHKWQVALDLVAVLPLIGAVKNARQAGELAQSVLSYGDEISGVLNALPSGADEAAGLIGGLAKNSDEVGELAQGVIRYGDEVEGAAGDILPRATKALRKIAADEPWLPANWKEQLEEGWAAGAYEDEVAAKGAGDVGLDSDILIDSYKNMRNNPDITGQAHHLNQNAAFRDVIPKNDGLSVELEGNAFKDIGSPHYSAHENLENFWNNFRPRGDQYGGVPTISDYNSALYDSLRAAGLTDIQAKSAVQGAIKQQSQYGLASDSLVPRIPGRINFRK